LFQTIASFLIFTFQQSGVAMRLRCDAIIMITLLNIYCWVWWWKNFKKSVSSWQSYGQE